MSNQIETTRKNKQIQISIKHSSQMIICKGDIKVLENH